jgi:large subunit ribosomal protein L5
MSAIQEYYQKECVPQLMEQFGYKNIMEVPQLGMIVLNMGLGEGVQNPKSVDLAAQELTLIAGQKAVITKAKKSIAPGYAHWLPGDAA